MFYLDVFRLMPSPGVCVACHSGRWKTFLILSGRFSTYEIDFLDANFKGCVVCWRMCRRKGSSLAREWCRDELIWRLFTPSVWRQSCNLACHGLGSVA